MRVTTAPRATAQLVARESELERALHSLRYTGGVMITGEAGVGKTALAAAVAEQLSAPPVGWVVATAASRSIPLGALANLLPADLASIHPALIAQHVAARLRDLARAESRSTAAPVLVVDDAQLLDAQSAAILLSLVSARSLRLLLTMRSGGTPSDAVTALWKEQLVDRLDLGPLDLRASRRLVESLVDGPVASGTVEMLWAGTHGNPLYLTELTRFGLEHDALECRSGLWWWLGGTDVPPRLGELLTRRLSAVSPVGREAVDLLALGEPLPYETLSALAGPDAVAELDQAQIVTSDERAGVLLLRFAHPLLHAAAEAELSAARRRALAARLRSAPARHVDVVRRATWEDLGTDTPDVDLLLSAADAVMLNDARAAIRLADRAVLAGGGIRAVTTLAAAHGGDGRADLALRTLDAAPEPTGPDELYAVLRERLNLALWGLRSPECAAELLDEMRARLPAAYANRVLGAEAVVTLFTGGGLDAIAPARRLLASAPTPSDRVRALTVLTGAYAFADRGPEAIEAGQQLLDALAVTAVSAQRAGMAHALIATAGLFFGVEYQLPRAVGLLGRWPDLPDRLRPSTYASSVDPTPGPIEESGEIGWPLLVGLRRHLAGDLVGAVGPLREAYVQQLSGEGMFRSEATAELVVVLAELGYVDEAEEILRDHPPDGVAIIPGLLPWARSAVLAAAGHHTAATASALEAARHAAGQGVAAMAMNFLTDAGRYGDARQAAAALPGLGLALDTDVQRVRASDLMARGRGRSAELLDAAEVQLAAGFARHAAELAELAGSGTDAASARRGASVLRRVRASLGDQVASAVTPLAGPLTRRETEVARLASRGSSDRDIADELFLSVRTVQSHLASAYRKLGINSRTQLSAICG